MLKYRKYLYSSSSWLGLVHRYWPCEWASENESQQLCRFDHHCIWTLCRISARPAGWDLAVDALRVVISERPLQVRDKSHQKMVPVCATVSQIAHVCASASRRGSPSHLRINNCVGVGNHRYFLGQLGWQKGPRLEMKWGMKMKYCS